VGKRGHFGITRGRLFVIREFLESRIVRESIRIRSKVSNSHEFSTWSEYTNYTMKSTNSLILIIKNDFHHL
jgi:hypothetical protein